MNVISDSLCMKLIIDILKASIGKCISYLLDIRQGKANIVLFIYDQAKLVIVDVGI